MRNSQMNPKDSPVAKALRSAGFVPLPRLWIKATSMPDIHAICNQFSDEVNIIRREAKSSEARV